MLDSNYTQIAEKIHNHLNTELKEYGDILESIFYIEKETSELILTSFLSVALCRRKIMLRKEEIDYGFREYQRD